MAITSLGRNFFIDFSRKMILLKDNQQVAEKLFKVIASI